jgi:ComF family protein
LRRARRWLRSLGRDALSFAAPWTCLICEASQSPSRAFEGALCEICVGDLPWLPAELCPRCSSPRPPRSKVEKSCELCPKPARWRRGQALFSYEGRARQLVQALKYQARHRLAPCLARVLARRCRAQGWAESLDGIVEVPLAWTRQVERGFNQSEELARVLAKELRRPRIAGAIRRTRATPPLFDLKASERRAVLEGVFEAKTSLVAGKRLLIVDDVRTTGATLNACVAALKSAGARSVDVAVIAVACPKNKPDRFFPPNPPAGGEEAQPP